LELRVLKYLRKRWSRTASVLFSAPIQASGVIYAVGDIHGRYDLFSRLLDRILQDAAACELTPKIVFLGDYVDRGENARDTVDLLIALADQTEIETVFLMGNHEQMLLGFLRDPSLGPRWLQNGGLQTLASYRVGSAGNYRDAGEALNLRGALIEALGPHLGFFEGLRLSHHEGNLFFAHAGADPALPTDEQEIATLMWGCERFRRMDRDDGVWVVHGHYVVEEPVAERGRIAVDTGAYFSDRLTAARIAGGEVSFLQG
jgi:serine/threonine protein phosphatase 1